ncbi:hypothetical protein HanXRQr2_Chr15g0690151 [Helianthus annuus]|uniref:Uncharacterized protein n=1 Tax=Helianthus annuus TaxID=4232 RepID=A0A9K3E1L7_HELAN|nr:hypothetical protein HanXRQr2_Chr15g0690151 [Helianthus annuus]KAJ0831003.1 hypothetical protein HanPSC8_Chr15g0662021 [Helianthus annuus]
MFSEFGFFKSTVALSLFSGFIAVADGSYCLVGGFSVCGYNEFLKIPNRFMTVAWQGCWMVGWILQPALQLRFLGTLSL